MPPAPVQKRLDKFIVVTDDGHWLWSGQLDRHGYGVFTCNGKWQAHVFVYEWYIGPVPVGLELDHLCEYKSCVNPFTCLEPVTHSTNMKRIGERRGTCRNGHVRTKANTRIRSNGVKDCRECDLKLKRAKASNSAGSHVPAKKKGRARRS